MRLKKENQRVECDIDGCSAMRIAKGLCNMHYRRNKKHGSPLINLIKINPCLVEGCEVRRARQGYCSRHWGYFSRYGSATPNVKLKFHGKTFDESYNHHVIRLNKKECWGWSGSINNSGYGYFSCKGIQKAAHRYSYEKNIGPIPDGLWVLHKCDNPKCNNPEHLFLGDNSANTKDAYSKGRRQKIPIEFMRRGKESHLSKLTEEEVICIKKLLSQGRTNTEIARLFGVTHGNISCIKLGQTWKHLECNNE
jgi:hypothetical protein